jgi:Bestrophin, RFP-TM, chloride channel
MSSDWPARPPNLQNNDFSAASAAEAHHVDQDSAAEDLAAFAQVAALAPNASDHLMQRPRLLGHQARLYKDRVFDDSAWSAHLSFRRYLPEPVILLKVFVAVLYPVATVVLVALGCGLYESLKRSESPSLTNLNLTLPYSLCSFALALLLVFKTNESYARWWEGAPPARRGAAASNAAPAAVRDAAPITALRALQLRQLLAI